MWSGLRFEINPVVAAVSTLLLGISLLTLLAIGLLRRRASARRAPAA
jgi:ABC-type spermidine/putrescine transport system permease subunit II